MKMSRALIFFWLWWFGLVGMFGAEEMKAVSVTEGDSVTLHTDTEMQRDDLILWRFGAEDSPMAEVNRSAQTISVSENRKGLKDGLHVDHQTGDLTIRNISISHSGVYKAQIIGNKVSKKMFNVTVYARLPVPVISRNSLQYSSPSSSSLQNCSVVCSVVNVSHVTLSWLKGHSLLSSISVSDLSSSVSLHLLEYEDNNTYSCVLNNSISNQSTHLDISGVCPPSSADSDCICCCDSTKAVIQLVLSALVGVATVVVLCFDITSRKTEEKRAEKSTSVKQ